MLGEATPINDSDIESVNLGNKPSNTTRGASQPEHGKSPMEIAEDLVDLSDTNSLSQSQKESLLTLIGQNGNVFSTRREYEASTGKEVIDPSLPCVFSIDPEPVHSYKYKTIYEKSRGRP